MDASISAIIVAGMALVGNLVGSWMASNKSSAVMQEQIRDIKEDISVLSNRVDKHNGLVERMALVEASTKSAHKRMDDAGIGRSKG